LGYLLSHRSYLLDGLEGTLLVCITTIPVSLVLGALGGVAGFYRIPILHQVLHVIIEIVRNTPLYLQLIFVFFALPTIGVRLSPFVSGFLTLSVWGSVYNSENFRAGFEAVDRHIIEGAEAIGLTRPQTFLYAVLPIGFRIAFRSVLNTSIALLKDSSYLVAVGYLEATDAVYSLVNLDFRVTPLFAFLAVVYLGLVWGLSRLAGVLERWLMRPYDSTTAGPPTHLEPAWEPR
jgi:His/Glu/Gln/Arg/opine family amino acid ABC transporter permease subunit